MPWRKKAKKEAERKEEQQRKRKKEEEARAEKYYSLYEEEYKGSMDEKKDEDMDVAQDMYGGMELERIMVRAGARMWQRIKNEPVIFSSPPPG